MIDFLVALFEVVVRLVLLVGAAGTLSLAAHCAANHMHADSVGICVFLGVLMGLLFIVIANDKA